MSHVRQCNVMTTSRFDVILTAYASWGTGEVCSPTNMVVKLGTKEIIVFRICWLTREYEAENSMTLLKDTVLIA